MNFFSALEGSKLYIIICVFPAFATSARRQDIVHADEHVSDFVVIKTEKKKPPK